MRPAKALDLIKALLTKPAFTSKEARALGVPPEVLSHYTKTGRLERIRHGVYRNPEAITSVSLQWEDLVEAVLSIPKGTICLTSALAIYGLTEEIPRQHWISVSHDTTVKAIRPVKIVRYRNPGLGRTEINLQGVRVPIYDRERTVIDAFRLLSLEVAIKALKAALATKGPEKLNLVKLQQYARQLRVPIGPYLLTATT